MSKIYKANSTDFVVSNDPEKAAAAYKNARSVDASTIEEFAATEKVILSDQTYNVTIEILPAGAVSAGAKVYPEASPGVYIENDTIPFTAVPAGAYPNFTNWVDKDTTDVLGTNALLDLTIIKDITLQATFAV